VFTIVSQVTSGAQPVSLLKRHREVLTKNEYPLLLLSGLIRSFYVCEKSDGVRCLMYMTTIDPQHGNFAPATYLVVFYSTCSNYRSIERTTITGYPGYNFRCLNEIRKASQPGTISRTSITEILCSMAKLCLTFWMMEVASSSFWCLIA